MSQLPNACSLLLTFARMSVLDSCTAAHPRLVAPLLAPFPTPVLSCCVSAPVPPAVLGSSLLSDACTWLLCVYSCPAACTDSYSQLPAPVLTSRLESLLNTCSQHLHLSSHPNEYSWLLSELLFSTPVSRLDVYPQLRCLVSQVSSQHLFSMPILSSWHSQLSFRHLFLAPSCCPDTSSQPPSQRPFSVPVVLSFHSDAYSQPLSGYLVSTPVSGPDACLRLPAPVLTPLLSSRPDACPQLPCLSSPTPALDSYASAPVSAPASASVLGSCASALARMLYSAAMAPLPFRRLYSVPFSYVSTSVPTSILDSSTPVPTPILGSSLLCLYFYADTCSRLLCLGS